MTFKREGNTHDRRVISAVLHWLVFTCTEDSAHSIPPTRTVHSHWHLEAEHEANIYTQEIGKCHVSGLLKIQRFLRAGLHPTVIVNTSVSFISGETVPGVV